MTQTPVDAQSSWVQTEKMFFLRRAYFLGEAKRGDFIQAFEANPRTASRRLLDAMAMTFVGAEGKLHPMLEKSGHGALRLAPEAHRAPLVSRLNEHLSNVIASGIEDPLFFCMTGLRTEELNLHRAPWVNPLPAKPHILGHVVRELTHPPGLLDLSYVSLSQGTQANRMLVIPLSMQSIGDQISLYGHCLWKVKTKEEEPVAMQKPRLIKGQEHPVCLVLSRIVESRPVSFEMRRAFRVSKYLHALPNSQEDTTTYPVNWNPDLTPSQREVLERELYVTPSRDGMDYPTLTHLKSRAFQFQRLFCDQQPRGVWPPLFLVDPHQAPSLRGQQRNPSAEGEDHA